MPTEITVRGSFAAFEAPERASVHAVIGRDGPDMDSVYAYVTRALEDVTASIGALHDPDRGPVTWWSQDQLQTSSSRPFNNKGEQLPLVHRAAGGLQVKFGDFGALSRWVGQHVTGTDGFRILRIEWVLTTQRRHELTAYVRNQAVADAVTRAQQYAQALGVGEVRPVAIADAGMLGAGLSPAVTSQTAYLRAAPGSAAAPADVEFTPKDIEVSATVDARFAADGSDAAAT